MQQKLGKQVPRCIGEPITVVQDTFRPIFNLASDKATSSDFDRLFKDGDTFSIGSINVQVLSTPGHTPACISYYIPDDAIFVGDTIFMPDQGTARCDFPHGSAEILWNSIQKILSLPASVRIFVGHDYRGVKKERDTVSFETTVADELASSIHVSAGSCKEKFLVMRRERDATLAHPDLILPSIKVNICGGKFPEPENNGLTYLKIPINKI